MKTGSDLIAEAKTRIRQVTVAEVQQALAGAAAPLVIDCREPQETNLGRIPGALVIPRGVLETKIEAVAPRDADIVLYCASGNRSAPAAAQPPKPPAIDATRVYPICCIVSAASADRFPLAQ